MRRCGHEHHGRIVRTRLASMAGNCPTRGGECRRRPRVPRARELVANGGPRQRTRAVPAGSDDRRWSRPPRRRPPPGVRTRPRASRGAGTFGQRTSPRRVRSASWLHGPRRSHVCRGSCRQPGGFLARSFSVRCPSRESHCWRLPARCGARVSSGDGRPDPGTAAQPAATMTRGCQAPRPRWLPRSVGDGRPSEECAGVPGGCMPRRQCRPQLARGDRVAGREQWAM